MIDSQLSRSSRQAKCSVSTCYGKFANKNCATCASATKYVEWTVTRPVTMYHPLSELLSRFSFLLNKRLPKLSRCASCKPGYALNEKGACLKCDPNCADAQCTDPLKCRYLINSDSNHTYIVHLISEFFFVTIIIFEYMNICINQCL